MKKPLVALTKLKTLNSVNSIQWLRIMIWKKKWSNDLKAPHAFQIVALATKMSQNLISKPLTFILKELSVTLR